MRRATSGMWLAALSVLAACPQNEVPRCEVAEGYEQALELGVGERSFTALRAGEALRSVWGAQGGQHVWMALRARGIDPGRSVLFGASEPGPEIALALRGDDGVEYGYGSSPGLVFDGDPELAEIAGLLLFLDASELPDGPPPVVYTLDVRGEDACGTALAAVLDVGLAW